MTPDEKRNFLKLHKRLLLLQYKVSLYELDGIDPPGPLVAELKDIERLIAIILRARKKSPQRSDTPDTKVSF